MARATHRLDLCLVPIGHDAPARVAAAFEALVRAGVVSTDGLPGPRRAELARGFGRLRVDLPGGRALYGNRTGGFRVTCPTRQAPIAGAFAAAVEAWRAGGPAELTCPACGATHGLEDGLAAPPIALGTAALVLVDVEEASLAEGGAARLGELGEHRLVPIRV